MWDPGHLVDEGRQRPVSPRRALGCAAAFLASLLAGVALLGSLMPPYLRTGHLRAKLEHLEAHGARYDTLFVGSSRVHRQIAPEVFDAETAAAGLPTRSFNLGIGGMRGLETEFVLEQALALELPNLRWVWIEPGDPAQRTDALNRRSERYAAWHDPRYTWRALDLWLGGERPGYDWRSWAGEHLPALMRRTLQVGRGVDRLQPRPPSLPDHLGPTHDGFRALDGSDDPRVVQRREEFLEELAEFRQRRDLLEAEVGSWERELEPFERRFFLRLAAHAERAGARALFLSAPTLSAKGEGLVRAAAQGLVPVAFHYADPRRHPDFYREELRFDPGHLNREGAQLFTRQLARDFAAYARGLETSPPERLARRASAGALRTGSR